MEWEILSHAKKGALFVLIAVPDHPNWLYTGLCPGSIKIKYDISYIYHIETGSQSRHFTFTKLVPITVAPSL